MADPVYTTGQQQGIDGGDGGRPGKTRQNTAWVVELRRQARLASEQFEQLRRAARDGDLIRWQACGDDPRVAEQPAIEQGER
ncbi:MAG TPA: hypothetical protein DGT21_01765 [Armatimonadetes bacterium]|jgi:hypothetical protein|nr:hypothetical protein [Armatimonadota bacterium]